MNATELLQLYSAGERDFSGQDLKGIKLSSVSLDQADFLNVNLANSYLNNTSWFSVVSRGQICAMSP
jgi:hypothetical protein